MKYEKHIAQAIGGVRGEKYKHPHFGSKGFLHIPILHIWSIFDNFLARGAIPTFLWGPIFGIFQKTIANTYKMASYYSLKLIETQRKQTLGT